MNLKDFYDTKQGYLVKNTCIIEAHICIPENAPKIHPTILTNPTNNNTLPTIPESNNHHQQNITEATPHKEDNHQTSPEDSDETSDTSTSCLTSMSSHINTELDEVTQFSDLTLRDLIDVTDFGPGEEESFLPLLEEACTWHPQLISSQMDRTRGFKLWAFTSLGRVLYFLKTKRVKDMDEDGCKYLQGLWDEIVKSSGFDLTWLEPYVQSAMMSAKNNMPKVEKVTQKMNDLEIKVKKLKDELAIAEMEHELARRELIENQQCFHELDLNAALDYAMF